MVHTISIGERCALNEIEACPSGYICVGDSGAGADNMYGICCKAFPKCLRRGQKAYYLSKRQVIFDISCIHIKCKDKNLGFYM